MSGQFMKKTNLLLGVLPILLSQNPLSAQHTVDFERDVKPILELNCVSCHREDKAKGKLRLDNKEGAFKSDEVIVKGKPDDSLLYVLSALPADDDDVMPPQDSTKSYPMPAWELEILKQWIKEGAKWPDGVTLKPAKRLPAKVDFVEHIQPILEFNCVRCHRDGNDKGDLRLDTEEHTFASMEVLTPGKPLDSTFYTLCILPPDDEDIMPPEPDEPLSQTDLWFLRRWIAEGAKWAKGVTLVSRKKQRELAGLTPKELYQKLGFQSGAINEPKEKYKQEIPLTDDSYSFNMVPIPAGTYKMGSPKGESDRLEDEPLPHEVQIGGFWMASHELTWPQYELWMTGYDINQRKQLKKEPRDLDLLADAVTRPTPAYTDMSFGMGKETYPAICMTQLSARVFTMWLSAKTGRFYRLPTEAEWEYACRAGTTTAYYFGDDASQLKEHGWFFNNSRFQYQPVGSKKPNPWGLYDMHGNVWEWCLDQYVDGRTFSGKRKNPLTSPVTLYPRIVKGGGWDDNPDRLRSAARMASHPEWKQQDPQIPKSVWYHTDAHWVGIRLIRPMTIPPIEDIEKYWPTLKEMQAIPER